MWLSTHYHDDLAAYHVEEDASTEKILLLSVILANFWKVEVGTLEMGCELDHSDREAIIARAKPSLF